MPSMVAGMGGAFHVGNPAAAARRSKPGVAPAPGENVGISARAPTSAAGGSTSGGPSSVSVPTSFFFFFELMQWPADYTMLVAGGLEVLE